MNYTKILKMHQEGFLKGLQQKTSWGRNEVTKLFIETQNIAMEKFIEEVEKEINNAKQGHSS